MMVGIAERTAQRYVKLYKNDEEKHLPDIRKPRTESYSLFFCDFYGKKLRKDENMD
jgi:hypothetical protein